MIYSNSGYYLSGYLWKQVNNEGRLCGDNIVFEENCYVIDYPKLRYYGRDSHGEAVGYYLFCLNYGFDSRLWVYSFTDNRIGVYRNAIPRK